MNHWFVFPRLAFLQDSEPVMDVSALMEKADSNMLLDEGLLL
jgi:hypothetical protein